MIDLVALNQTSFVPGRHIEDNIITVQELIHMMSPLKRRGKRFVAIKVDLEKAIDRLRWDFIWETLESAGLPDKLRRVIMDCVATPTNCGFVRRLIVCVGALFGATMLIKGRFIWSIGAPLLSRWIGVGWQSLELGIVWRRVGVGLLAMAPLPLFGRTFAFCSKLISVTVRPVRDAVHWDLVVPFGTSSIIKVIGTSRFLVT
ncbi:hypothetical protein CRG98_037444 [Punica granatum]|uniref:Uncharacterized protein n=1 Tax=Punica granatum TaxID=22663 RepID=A0A2I0IDU3_PUNGR|nr:hypothetical protein CRG98_037444 [Punica granatum]